jgi:hypothetical protein
MTVVAICLERAKMATSACNRDGRETHRLSRLIAQHRGEAAFACAMSDSGSKLAHRFNSAAANVNADRVDRMYSNFKRILVEVVNKGEVRSANHYLSFGTAVLNTLGRHHEILTWHRDHPLLPTSASILDSDPAEQIPLFAASVDVADVATATENPADRAIRNELYATILRVAREIGSFNFRAIQIHRRYVFENRKAHGGYVHLARFAVLDHRGRVIAFRPWRTVVDLNRHPEARIIRQVRVIHRAAERRLLIIARCCGIELPPAG